MWVDGLEGGGSGAHEKALLVVLTEAAQWAEGQRNKPGFKSQFCHPLAV